MVDPWCYRERLTMPKLVVSGTSDPYWAMDAIDHFWPDLRGEKHLLLVPNGGHHLEDWTRILATLPVFFRSVAEGPPLPSLSADEQEARAAVHLRETGGVGARSARLWSTRAVNGRFLECRWESWPMVKGAGGFSAPLPSSAAEAIAWFTEVEFHSECGPYTLSTPLRVVPQA
jgi:PhoPQ-activated pathogenicity-related protein